VEKQPNNKLVIKMVLRATLNMTLVYSINALVLLKNIQKKPRIELFA